MQQAYPEYLVYWDDARQLWVLESRDADRAVITDETKEPVKNRAYQVARNNDAKLRVLNKRGGLVDQRSYHV